MSRRRGDAQGAAQLGAYTSAERDGMAPRGRPWSSSESDGNATGTLCRSLDGDNPSSFPPLHGKINHKDGVFLDDAIRRMMPMSAMMLRSDLMELNGEERADSRGRNRGENGDG